MAETTSGGLVLPAYDETEDVGVLNENFRKLDKMCSDNASALSGQTTSLGDVAKRVAALEKLAPKVVFESEDGALGADLAAGASGCSHMRVFYGYESTRASVELADPAGKSAMAVIVRQADSTWTQVDYATLNVYADLSRVGINQHGYVNLGDGQVGGASRTEQNIRIFRVECWGE